MTEYHFTPELADIAKRRHITSGDVLTLRKKIFADGIVSAAEANSMFMLNNACGTDDLSWNIFFKEALTDYLVHQAEPRGYVTVENAEWLIDHISRDGKVDTRTELELLLNVLEKARWSPERLVQYALEQVKYSVQHSDGPIRNGMRLVPGAITKAEIDMLRRILYAFAGQGNIAISRSEAEILLDLNDMTKNVDNDPEWSEFFVKAIANHVMGVSGYKVPTREEALRLEDWADSQEGGVLDFMKNMASGGVSSVQKSYAQKSSEELALERVEQQKLEIVIGETITQDEAAWLSDRIGSDGELDDNERAILLFISDESANIHPSLKVWIEKAS